ncbi:hypothetical protein PMAYCL1PPCAC_03891, partial [Pristionchus mayeri]
EKYQDVLILSHPKPIESLLDKIMLDLLILENAHDRLRTSSYCPKFVEGLKIEEFILGPSKLGVTFHPMKSQAYEPTSANLVTVEVVIKNKICMDLSNFDYANKKLWMFHDVIYSIEFIKALSVYQQLEDCSKRALIASALACSNFKAAFYSYTHYSDRTYYPDGGTMSWSKEIQAQAPGSTRMHTGIIAAIREAKLDVREYTLLKMIIVLNPRKLEAMN